MAPITTGTLSVTTTAAAATILVAVVVASLAPTMANDEVDALMVVRDSLDDPQGMLTSWSSDLVDPCSWIRVSCDDGNRVNRLDLGYLNLSGNLAPELGKLEHLQYMEMAGNNIQGSIPTQFGNLSNLLSIDLFKNNLSGPIPATIGNLKSLKFLRIDHNRLTGPIPGELAGLSDLLDVDFSNNDFCGTMPTSGTFQKFPLSIFDNNPRMKQPGTGGDDSNC